MFAILVERNRLSKYMLGTRSLAVALAAVWLSFFLVGCHHSPTEPIDGSLTGQWAGTLGRSPCAGDWSTFALDLVQTGNSLTGEVITRDGRHFSASGSIVDGSGSIDVSLPVGMGECQTFPFQIQHVEHDGMGRAIAFSGNAGGRCCGTIDEGYRYVRA